MYPGCNLHIIVVADITAAAVKFCLEPAPHSELNICSFLLPIRINLFNNSNLL